MDYYNVKIMNDPEYLKGFSKRFNAPLIDRSGIMSRDIKVISQITSKAKPPFKKFGKIADHRGYIILKKASDENRDIRVSYSGGIDSTTALISLIKSQKEFPEVKIIVVMNKQSIEEYPLFYKKYIKGKMKVWMSEEKNLHKILQTETEKDFFIVTGELGDQLFGSALMFRENLNKDLDKFWAVGFTPKFVKYWQPLVDKHPQQDDLSVANVLWWFNFVLKYQWVQLRMFVLLEGEVPLESFIHFFAGPRFQAWAMNSPMSVKFPDLKDDKTYKNPAKKYILNFTGDKEYFKNKLKKGSLKGNLDDSISKGLVKIGSNMKMIRDTDAAN